MQELPYGSWPSPISAADLVSGTAAPTDVWAERGVTWWSQTRPDQGGRVQLVRREQDGAESDVLPDIGNARTRVHEYGGGAWWVHAGVVFAAAWSDQRLTRIEPGGLPRPITPEPTAAHALRYADGRVTPDGGTVVCVRERHEGPAATEVFNEIVALPADPDGAPEEPVVLFGSSDFVAAPRISPDGRRIAWLSWDHPDMPWTATRLWVADLGRGGWEPGQERPHLHHPRLVAGGVDEALVQPEWGPDGALYVVSDRSDWWNVYRVDVPEKLGASADLVPVHLVAAEVGLPAWSFGQSRYQVAADGTVWLTYSVDDAAQLVAVGPEGSTTTALPYDALTALRIDGDRLVAIATSATAEPEVVELAVGQGFSGITVLREPEPHGLPQGSVSVPRQISFPSIGGRTAHAWFYPPANVNAVAPIGERPPLLVAIHGGPTAAAVSAFRPSMQYWTTRGFAVVDVNYGGSTGFGRHYRGLLDGAWGVVDVEDACAAAAWLAEQGLVDGARLAIRGGSAGGFTTLAALATQDVFAAGASHFGVADLGALARDTHKFESRYLDGLVGPWPSAEAVYVERSPLTHIDGFDRPLIVLQGDEDAVVPPAQAEMIVQALAAKRVPHAYLLFAGEQHGFRRAENIIRAVEAEYAFYARVFGFETSGGVPPVEIAFAESLPG